jgi:uncharacterized protein (DUF1800 family)
MAFTYDDAAHLMRRMAFGGSQSDINALLERGREGAVDYLINYNQINDADFDKLIDESFDLSDPRDGEKFNLGEITRWWTTLMTLSRRQFEEKMTLFWHNHFATANSKVEDVLMYIQNRTLRKHALDRFDTLLLKVAKDPAMLVWLDGVTNVADAPNENFARELMELFTMGITDPVTGQRNYTERDVQEVARAFTGWSFSAPDEEESNPFNYQFEFNEDQHDFRPKTVFGRTANYEGEDIIEIIAARRETARFLVKKFFEFFVYPLTDSAADRATIDKFADVYVRRDHSIKELARAIFSSDEFFSQRARFALVKQPLELVIGAARLLEARFTPGTYDNHEPAHILWYAAAELGQNIFNPPDVSGWNLNLGWLNTAVMLNRFNYAAFFAASRPENDGEEPGLYLTLSRLKKLTKKDAKKTVRKFLSVMGPLNLDAATRDSLIAYLETDSDGSRVEFRRTDEVIDKKVRGLVHLIMCLAEFQVN